MFRVYLSLYTKCILISVKVPLDASFTKPIQIWNMTGRESTVFLTNSISAFDAKLTTFEPIKKIETDKTY